MKNNKVLVVDDDVVNREFILAVLETESYEVKTADSGEEALKIFGEFAPDIVLLDIMMEGVNGYEVCQQIRKEKGNNSTRILLLSAMTQLEDRLNGYNVGADDYLTKPFEEEELLAKLRVFIRLKTAEEGWRRTEKELFETNRSLLTKQQEIQELNRLLEKKVIEKTIHLEGARQEIIQQKHKSGLADIATETLHNVKNILNSISLTTDMIERFVSGPAIFGFRKANHLVKEHIADIGDFISNDVTGKKLMPYYLELEKSIDYETKEFNDNITVLKERIRQIEEIITTQQEYGGRAAVLEVSLNKMVNDALFMQFGNRKHLTPPIEKRLDYNGTVLAHKTKLMHVLLNLVKNAREAMSDMSNEERKLTIVTDETETSVRLKISDNGFGIPPENMKNLFTYGFSTKETGHGFGLHSCKIYMEEMNGRISGTSDGEGKGACFTLEFLK